MKIIRIFSSRNCVRIDPVDYNSTKNLTKCERSNIKKKGCRDWTKLTGETQISSHMIKLLTSLQLSNICCWVSKLLIFGGLLHNHYVLAVLSIYYTQKGWHFLSDWCAVKCHVQLQYSACMCVTYFEQVKFASRAACADKEVLGEEEALSLSFLFERERA